ncbi:MAG: acyl-CoA desaturase [Labilithrix sp.]|nr:acyl-CoA desaturase [Labilithrix sp.]
MKRRVLARMGEEDVRYVKRLNRFSRAMEIAGRVLIHVSPEPITFFLGVGALWIHKQLQATEVGHTALHGAYDRLEGAEGFRSRTFRWDTPIDEESWREGHNVRHHGNTNVAGRDPDIHFGPVRLTEQTPHAWHHRFQLPFTLGILFPNFAFLMNLHFTGLNDVFSDNGIATKLDVLPDRSPESKRLAWKRTLRKYVPYYLKNYVFFPLLAGPFWWKVLLGNWLAETMRDVYSAATIYCGHVGHDVASYAIATKARGRGQWYAMQVAATNDYEVSRPISILCGGLDRQIEHHLFPTLPPHRLREIAPEVRAICERHGVPYKTDTWGRTLKKALAHVAALSRQPGGVRQVIREMA